MFDADTEYWLRTLPLDSPVAVDGVEVWLKAYGGGAELGAYLVHACSEEQLHNAVKQGFRSAVEFDAGFSLSADGKALCLSQWLPAVGNWVEAAQPLEKLLNQVGMLQAAMDPVRSALMLNPIQDRIEQRMRKMLEGRVK